MKNPCHKCLTLSICKSIAKEGNLSSILSLSERCYHFKQYIFINDKNWVHSTDDTIDYECCLEELKRNLIKNLQYEQYDLAEKKNIKIKFEA